MARFVVETPFGELVIEDRNGQAITVSVIGEVAFDPRDLRQRSALLSVADYLSELLTLVDD